MNATDAAVRLDGNAAGLLAELFRPEMTAALVSCAGCGGSGPIAELALYGHDMGNVLRCTRCDAVVIRVSRTAGRLWLDLRGASVVCIDAGAA